jgi:predicted peptidase
VTLLPEAFVASPGRYGRLDYLLHVPAGAAPDGGWPLVLFLHGAGERGRDLDLVKREGLPRVVASDPGLGFVTVAPQCPPGATWQPCARTVLLLLDHVLATRTIDTGRVYLTGISMGGYGTWALAATNPDRFAAIVPICGGGLRSLGFPDKVRELVRVPVWAFHGALDDIVPPDESRRLVDVLAAAGGDVRFTLYPDLGHDSWSRTYADPELYAWLLSHRRRPAGVDPGT